MKTKQLTMLESRLHFDLEREIKNIDKRCEEAIILEKVQLISIPEFATLPKKVEVDKEECKEYMNKHGWQFYSDDFYIPDEINTSTLYVGWFYQDKNAKYALCFENERFDLRERRVVTADITRMYLVQKFLKEKGYETGIAYLTDESIRNVEERILADIRSFYMNEAKLEQGLIDKAMELGVEEAVIRCCLNVERKYNKRMINFLDKFWNKGKLLENKVQEYLTEVGAM